MHFVIMGCGHVGATLAQNLTEMGHSVAIIDQSSESFNRLPENFQGQRVTGVGFDKDTLERAGISEAYGFAAVSAGDNTNIVAARVAREEYGIDNVVVRIYDPARADVYERLGIATVPTVRWTANRVLRHLINLGPHYDYTDENAGISIIGVDVHEDWYGLTVENVEHATSARVAYITRLARGMLPTSSTVLQDGDQVYMAVDTRHASSVQHTLVRPPEEDAL